MVGSSGGHLAQLVALQSWWETEERAWVTFDTADTQSLLAGETVINAFSPTTRNIPNLLRNARLAARVLRELRPKAVVSTGAGVAVPFFILARLMGIATVYLEVIDRMDTPMLTARLCSPFTSAMLVQWPEQRDFYRDSVVVGPVL
jgi:UDP-N-acetylglucosamine:LPS N-acetylglucosamine transferase